MIRIVSFVGRGGVSEKWREDVWRARERLVMGMLKGFGSRREKVVMFVRRSSKE